MDAAQRLEFAPPPSAGLPRALLLAVLAHVVLVTALTWGVRWKRDVAQVTAEAELWSSVAMDAAPRPVEAPPAPTPEPPTPQAATPPPDNKVDIALERDRQRQKIERQQAALKLEQQRREQAALDKKREQAQQAALDKKREQAQQAVLDKKKAEQSTRAADAAKSKQEAAAREAERQANIRKAQAGATGAPSATGNVLQSAAPSAGYAAKVVARIKPNVTFTEITVGNPMVEIELRAEPDGAIIISSIKVTKGSGNERFDAAVIRGIEKTRVLPRDDDGRVPSPMVISYSYR